MEAASGAGLPDGASVGAKPSEGLWFRLLDRQGNPVTHAGAQVRVP